MSCHVFFLGCQELRVSGRVHPGSGRPAIVTLSEADLPAVLALEKACFARPWSLEQLQSSFRQGALILLGARGSQGLVGYLILQVFAPEMEILNVAVIPGHRGQGLGRGLVRRALELGHARGAPRCFLEVAANNAAALNLYRSLGFATTGTRRGYYRKHGKNVDAVMMERIRQPDQSPRIAPLPPDP